MAAPIPGARAVDPPAEVARLADRRAARHARGDHEGYHLLLDEVHQVQSGDNAPPVFAHVVVTSAKAGTIGHDTGTKIAELLRATWEPDDDA